MINSMSAFQLAVTVKNTLNTTGRSHFGLWLAVVIAVQEGLQQKV